MKKLLLAGLILGFLTPGFKGIILDKAAELGLPPTYYFREEAFQPDRLNGPCQGASCSQGNFVLDVL